MPVLPPSTVTQAARSSACVHDVFFPLESRKPFFELLGTDPEHKAHIVYPAGHAVFTSHRNQAIGDILDWFDRYLGPT